MKFREWVSEKAKPGGGSEPDGSDSCDLDDLRQRGEGFLGVADLAIERALSGDSERFLRANRQEGGQ